MQFIIYKYVVGAISFINVLNILPTFFGFDIPEIKSVS